MQRLSLQVEGFLAHQRLKNPNFTIRVHHADFGHKSKLLLHDHSGSHFPLSTFTLHSTHLFNCLHLFLNLSIKWSVLTYLLGCFVDECRARQAREGEGSDERGCCRCSCSAFHGSNVVRNSENDGEVYRKEWNSKLGEQKAVKRPPETRKGPIFVFRFCWQGKSLK